MGKYAYNGDTERVFTRLKNKDGSTVKAEPGDVFEFVVDPQNTYFTPVADDTPTTADLASVTSTPSAPSSAPQGADGGSLEVTAEARAEALIAEAEEAAEKLLDEAKDAAEKAGTDVVVAVEAAKLEGESLLERAKAEAEKLLGITPPAS